MDRKKNKEKKAKGEITSELIKETLKEQGKDLSSEDITMLEEVLESVYIDGMLPKEALDINEDLINYMYYFACDQYKAARYDRALEIIKLLLHMDPTEAKYQHALGACYHRMKSYEQAITGYFVEAILDPENPVPFFHMYDCYLGMNNLYGAYANLKATITACNDNSKYQELKGRCQILIKGVAKRLGIEYKEETEEPDIFVKLQEAAKEEQK